MWDWSSVFDEATPAPGATDRDIERFVTTVFQPLSAAEIAEVNRSQRNPFPEGDPLHDAYRPFNPSLWVMPERTLPPDYLSFLRWSNGGWCRTGEREFGFFPTDHPTGGIRQMMLAYHLPEYMPQAMPFAFDGCGTFYLLDLRAPAKGGNYPVVCAHAGSLGWDDDDCRVIADSFEAACRGAVQVDELWGSHAEPACDATQLVAVYLERSLKSIKTLLIIKEKLGLADSMADLKQRIQSAPCCITDVLTYGQAVRRCAEVNAVEPCLGIRLMSNHAVRLPLDWPS